MPHSCQHFGRTSFALGLRPAPRSNFWRAWGGPWGIPESREVRPMASATPLLKDDKAKPGCVLGVLSEGFSPDAKVSKGDQRVSMVPDVAESLIKDGYAVVVERGAGMFAGYSDEAYASKGCEIKSRGDTIDASQVLFALEPPAEDFPRMNCKVLISWIGRLQDKGKDLILKANQYRITMVDVTAVPRITIAQKLDVLSSQAKVAGHRAVLEAAHSYQRFHTAEMTAAGKYPPAQTFVLGCGVAGLAAIGTSKALGSVVRAWDVRDVSDQVHSMGAKWVTVEFKEPGEGQGGYAKESSDAFKKVQQETFKKVLSECDIAISTAAIPGRPSPLLITKDAVSAMKPGSVIVDLAAIGGGNCELTRLNETIVTENNVTIIGYANLPARMAQQASAMYAQNMANLLRHVHQKGKAGAFLENLYGALDKGEEGDIVSRSIVCCRNGNPVAMPPPPQPTPIKAKPVSAQEQAKKAADPYKAALGSAATFAFTICCMLGLGEGVSTSLLSTFLLAGAAGYQAVWGVAHALHTPLMSVTNAISGTTAIGGLLLLNRSSSRAAQLLALVAVLVSAVNIIGGFVVSQRMLNLFKKGGEKDYSGFMLLPGLVFLFTCLTQKELLKDVSTVSALMCIAAIAGLATMSTANAGCKFGMVGVFGAMCVAMVSLDSGAFVLCSILLVVGGTAGLVLGVQVSPIALPQTVAAFHSLVGLAAMCTSIGSFVETPVAGATMENVAAVLGDFIGGVTLTGSLIAFGKLNGNLASKPLDLPGKNYLNLCGLLLFIFWIYKFLHTSGGQGIMILWLVAALACLMGLHLVGSVGGGDMPVCITVLNSYSGWALVAEGFLLQSPVLTIVGSLIGFSGAILTKIMCDAMNRDIMNVLFGGLNNAPAVSGGGDSGPKEHTETSCAAVAEMLCNAKEVLVVPGYGMAMARAQTAMGDLAATLRANNIKLKFGVHPVAGRMPGQMNVLLAEAGVPHEWVLEMDEVNPDMESNDVVLVVGANDVVNSAAQEIEGCAIWGMPVIEVWRSKKVIFCKRSMGGGYADLDNPVFYKENTEMLLGDAKKTSDSLAAMVRERFEKAASGAHQRGIALKAFLSDPADARLALYRAKAKRDIRAYQKQLQPLVATKADGPVDDQKQLRLRELPSIVAVHYNHVCLERLLHPGAVAAAKSVVSILVPQGASADLQSLAQQVAAIGGGDVLQLAPHLLGEFCMDISWGEPVRYAIAWPRPRELHAMQPPFLVLDGLVSAQNLGQVMRSAVLLGVRSVVLSRANHGIVSHGLMVQKKRKRKASELELQAPLGPKAKAKKAPKSRFWDFKNSLDEAAVAELRGGEAEPPTVEEESCRARAVASLRRRYLELCGELQLKAASPVFFDKWHCAWLCLAKMDDGTLRDPLLPMIEDFQVLDQAMVKALAFLPPSRALTLAQRLRAAAERKAKALPQKLQKLPREGHASLQMNGDEATLSFEGWQLPISQLHLQKLRALFRGEGEVAFVDAAFCCLLRYHSVLQKGFQGACTEEVFQALLETFDVRFECFASPLNCRYRWMCSAFPDTDSVFGSLGSFFAQTFVSGSFQLNPPFVDDIVISMVERLDEQLAAAEAQKSCLTFVVIVCANSGSRSGSAALQALCASTFLRAQVSVPKGTHQYFDGEQHLNQQSRPSPCETGVFVLQSRKAARRNPATALKMERIKESFALEKG
ncbi:unnamed protein product [Effrenium voratum]|uniref:proton-translocating NAD(P)(+) transhydrogenase n=1 Tax=Effrenium voratum TaxID=2562239 RepID=A0AA36IUJ6_9DINO|nr:unnamed protein product [Effrenium voratum]